MKDDAARTPEFGTGLRARLERADVAHVRVPAPPSRDLLQLVEEPPVEPTTPELALVSGDLARPRTPGPVAA